MPTPAVKAYDSCFKAKLDVNSDHDWSIPGAEVSAQIDCWCQHNLTSTIQDYQCCSHQDIYPMCDVQCAPDCSAPLAQECIQECPSMCFESAEYIVDASLCRKCNWHKCWPVLKCLTNHAIQRVDNGTLDRTCHESAFTDGPELTNYMKCWKVAPKHTSHWNILSSLVHCICEEGMDKKARDTHCCESVMYGGGVCDLECLSDQACREQDAQTCIHGCQRLCPAYDVVPSETCVQQCLAVDAPCRKYLSCRPPSVHTHICDDGRWPEASSGCCTDPNTSVTGCPSLCETQRVWRLDRTRAVPVWARQYDGPGIISQCTCIGCPESSAEKFEKLKRTVEESIWDNGQVMLTDIARREGLRLGANRNMQELMARRNEEITRIIANYGETGQADARIANVNNHYALLITRAAQLGEDPYVTPNTRDYNRREEDKDEKAMHLVTGVVLGCSIVILLAVAIATYCVVTKRRKETTVRAFDQDGQVVIGNPVPADAVANGGVTSGAPVTVAAPTKAAKSQSVGSGVVH